MDGHCPIIDSSFAIRAVEETREDGKMSRKKKRGSDKEKTSKKKKIAEDGKFKGGSRTFEVDDKMECTDARKKVTDYEEAGKAKMRLAPSKKHSMQGINVLDNGENGKRNFSAKITENKKDLKQRGKFSNEVSQDKQQIIGMGAEKTSHMSEGMNLKHGEFTLRQTVAEESESGRKGVDAQIGNIKSCMSETSKNKDKEEQNADVILHNRKKKKKGVRKGVVKAVELLSDNEKERKEEAVNEALNDTELNNKKTKVDTDVSTHSPRPEKVKRVRFSGEVEVFSFSDEQPEDFCEESLVQGKRFSKKEDSIVMEAVDNYIKAHNLGEKGLDMVLHCRAYPELKGCWKEIGLALPWRPYQSVYYRAHILYERRETTKWEPEEVEALMRHYEEHGSDWKSFASFLGVHRFHAKDAWRRSKLTNRKRGPWSQDEYQTLFDLVNKDLQMKAFEEKKTKHGMLRDNISWGAISDKLSTRINALCCMKWYNQLASSMVAEGSWDNTDDYRMLAVLVELDASSIDDVDWDNLLDHRSGELCLKRWKQMTKHIGDYRDRPFPEQVELLSNRYVPDLLEVLAGSKGSNP